MKFDQTFTTYSKKTKVLGLILVAAFVILLIWISYAYLGRVKITVKALPTDSIITLDNKRVKAGTIYLKHGKHTLKASRQYFDTTTKQIDTKDLDSSQVIFLLPAPNSEAAKDWLIQHPQIQKEREAVGGIDSEKIQNSLTQNNSAFTQLPVETLDYRIDYSINSNSTPELTITLYAVNETSAQYQQDLQQYKSEALGFLKDNGIDPGKYKITYIPNVP